MIKIYTSYFYQVRNMRPGCLAFSTAFSDPAWFKKDGQPWIDKNGVLNGLRAEPFVPNIDLPPQDSCQGPKNCKFLKEDLPWQCPFLDAYEKQIYSLDPWEMEGRFRVIGMKWRELNNEPDMPLTFILLVHEAPTNSCSERVVLQKWLRDNNMGGEEWTKDIKEIGKNRW